MNSDPAGEGKNWKRIEELYHEALSKPRAERSEFLEAACQGDAELRREVESLLASLEKDGALLDAPALEVAGRMLAKSPTSWTQGPRPILYLGPDLPGGEGTGEGSDTGVVRTLTRKIFHHAPWWMYLLAAIFAADCLLRAYCYILGPGALGFDVSKREKERFVFVDPSPAADRAGIRPGDVLLAIDGFAPRTPADAIVILSNSEVGRRYDLEIEREGKQLRFTVPVERVRIFQNWNNKVHAIWQINALLLLGTALFIAFARPFDPLARAGALALGTWSIGLYSVSRLPGYAAIWRNLPLGLGNLLWIPNLFVYLAGPIVLTFFVLFPRLLFRACWPWVIVWLPALCLVPALLHNTFLLVYRPPQVYGNLVSIELFIWAGRLIGLYGLASIAVLAANYLRLADPNNQRRLRVLVVGTGAAVLPGSLRLMIWQFAPLSGIFNWLISDLPDLLVALIFVLLPASFAYSILRHRLLDIRIIIRQGVQYAATRGALLSVVPVLGVILVTDLLVHGDQPLIGILEMRGWVYAALAAAAVAAHSQRRRWGEAIDRRFFREQYNARQLLREVVAEAGRARSFAGAAPGAVASIEAALHPEFAAILQRSSGDPAFRTLASAPPDKAPPPLDAKSSLISILRILKNPLEVILGKSGWLDRHLPMHEIESLRKARVDLLVPISMTLEDDEALLALGAKRSEEPYTREDQGLLAAIAANLGLLLERPDVQATRPSGEFEECPQCGTCYDTGSGRCAQESAGLTPIHMPRNLAGRYRLERRLGRGGMGAVYESSDRALGRRVAVKVIREDRLFSAGAALRFQREARAAAGFSHPNVVTVYDYGVEGGTRAFLVMELLEGATLREELKSCKRLSAARTVEIFRGVCSAVEAAHHHQLIHRDLKPENIFLVRSSDTESETVKILDFGIAKFLPGGERGTGMPTTGETDTGILVGTPGYISPEQLIGEKPALSWDLWALAVTAYETLTGALPFPTSTWDQWRQAVLAGRYTPLREHLADPPAPWQEFFARSLAADREMRPQSAAEFLRHLEQALA